MKKKQLNKRWIVFVIIASCCLLLVFAKTNSIHTFDNKVIPLKIDSKIQVLVENGKLPSLQIGLIENNNVAWLKTYGKETNKYCLYKIGSINKVITATALLQLHERGELDIYADVNEYLPFSVRNPNFPNDPISTIMLLSHRTGLDMFKYQFEWDTKELEDYKDKKNKNLSIRSLSDIDFIKASLDTLGTNFSSKIWMFKPGTNFQYSNSGYFILRYLIEQVSGQTYSQYITENIFQKLDMNNSVFLDAGTSFNCLNSFTRKADKNIKLPFLPGMYTNAEDMAKFMLAHMNNGQYNGISLLKPKTVELMQQKHSRARNLLNLSSKCQFSGYGLGIIYYGDNLFGHGGSTIGYQSLWSFNKQEKSGYIIFTNVNGLLYGKKNFDSVWNTVASIEGLLKSELGYSAVNYKVYFIIGIIAIILNIMYLKRRHRIKKLQTNNYTTKKI